MMTEFKTAPKTINLSAEQIDVWLVDLQQDNKTVQRVYQLLNQDEQARADRFHFERHRRRSIVARASLRKILSTYQSALTPTDWQFTYGEQGKPALIPEQNKQQLAFNVSHSHELALIAISKQHELGIDIEYFRADRAGLALAERFFSAQEVAYLQQLPTAEQQPAFFAIWTRKEAFIKAIARGLSFPLDKFAVNIKQQRANLAMIDDRDIAVDDWQLSGFNPAEGYHAALCHAPSVKRINYYRF